MQSIVTQIKLIHLNVWDRFFLVVFVSLVLWLFASGMTVLTFGGIVLIFGAFLTYKGQIYLAVGSYLMADFCWVYNAWTQDDMRGVVIIGIGILFGILASVKMQLGHMEKDLLRRD